MIIMKKKYLEVMHRKTKLSGREIERNLEIEVRQILNKLEGRAEEQKNQTRLKDKEFNDSFGGRDESSIFNDENNYPGNQIRRQYKNNDRSAPILETRKRIASPVKFQKIIRPNRRNPL